MSEIKEEDKNGLVWKPINGFPKYIINSEGFVMRPDQNTGDILNWGEGGGLPAKYSEGELIREARPYNVVSLSKNGITCHKYVHRLVAEHFCVNPDPETHVVADHYPDKTHHNNSASNLRWATQSMSNQNRDIFCNNQCGHKNITKREYTLSDDTKRCFWDYHKTYQGVRFRKRFNTLEEAIKFKGEQGLEGMPWPQEE